MFNRLPAEAKLTVFGFLPRISKVQLQLVSAEWLTFLREISLWLETGADDYQNFTLRIRLLSINLQNLIWAGIHTLTISEDVERISSLNVKQRQAELVLPEEAALMPDFPHVYYLDTLLSYFGVMALEEKLITPQQAAAIKTWNHLKALLSEYGVIALRGKYITVEQVNMFKSAPQLEELLSKKGLQALTAGSITTEQASLMPTSYSLKKQIKNLLAEHTETNLTEKRNRPR